MPAKPKRAKPAMPKPVKAWAIYTSNGVLADILIRCIRKDADNERRARDGFQVDDAPHRVQRVLVTPIPKKVRK